MAWKAAATVAALSLALAGCGGGTKTTQSQGGGASPAQVGTSPARAAFGWLRPAVPPTTWHLAPIASGAAMPYPPGWERVKGDAGTATAMLTGADDRVLGYLNLTPRQGDETLTNWPRFRTHHNAEEGDRHVNTQAVGRGLRFRTGRGTCVMDSYTTITHARYVEIACIVVGSKATSVIVGASPPGDWSRISPQIERALSGLTT